MSKSSLTLIFFLAVLLLLPAAGLASHRQKKRVSALRRSNMAQIQEQLKLKAFNKKHKKARPKAKKAGDLTSLRREINQLQADKNSGRLKFGIGPDHYARLKAKLDSLTKSGAAATDIKVLEEALLTLTPQLPNTPLSTDAAGAIHQKLKELKQEVAGFSKHKVPTKEHYHEIEKKLIWLTEQGAPAEELSAIRQALELWNPAFIAEGDQARQAVREEREKQQANQQQRGGPPSSPTCVSNPNPVFTHDITDLARVSQINAPVMLQNSGAVKSHSYLWINGGGEVPVYAPVDSRLVAVSYFEDDYGLAFEVGCGELRWRLGHITNPVDSIRAVLPLEPQGHSRDIYINPIHFPAGAKIADTSGTRQAHNWDFGVYDPNRTNSLSLSQPGVGEKDTLARCPYDYYPQEKKAEYYARFQPPPNSSVLLQLCRN